MEESQQIYSDNPSYWQSVFLVALIFGIISFAGQLIQGYVTINSGSQPAWMGFVFCLVIAFGGMVAVWHYVNQYEITITIGKGALIGFLVGCFAQLIGYGLLEIWQLLDPSYFEAYKEAQIAAIENNDQIPDSYKQQSIDFINDPSLMWTLLIYIGSTLLTGLVSLLTGMIGAKIFAKKEEVV